MLSGALHYVEPDEAIKIVDEDALVLEVQEKLMEFIKRYRAKSPVPRHSCAILRTGNRIKVVNGELLKRIAEICNTSDTIEETIEHIMKVLKSKSV